MEIGGPLTWYLIRKNARSDCAGSSMIWRKLRRKSWRQGYLRGSLIALRSENDTIVRARRQTKLAWRHRPRAAGRPLFEDDLSGCANFLDCEYRMDAPPAGEFRPQNSDPASQKRVQGSGRDFEFCSMVPWTIRLGTRPRPGFSRVVSKRMDCSRSAKGKSVFGLSDSREASRFCYDRLAPVNPSQHSVERYLELARLAGADTSGPILFPLPCGKTIPSLELPERFVVLHPFARGARKSLTPKKSLSLSICWFQFRSSSLDGPTRAWPWIATESRW